MRGPGLDEIEKRRIHRLHQLDEVSRKLSTIVMDNHQSFVQELMVCGRRGQDNVWCVIVVGSHTLTMTRTSGAALTH